MPALDRIGFWAGVAAFTATVAYDVVQILQVVGALRFPLDEILIFGTSLCIIVPFVLEILAMHYTTPSESGDPRWAPHDRRLRPVPYVATRVEGSHVA
jgi:hypothetical protein